MLARALTSAVVGLEPRRVEVEADLVSSDLPAFSIVGLADRACQEAKHRVRSGIASAELEWPDKRITVNLAPAALRKEGTGFDLAIALAVLAASHQIPPERLRDHSAVGELALDGRIRPVAGTIAFAEGARRQGLRRVLCAAAAPWGPWSDAKTLVSAAFPGIYAPYMLPQYTTNHGRTIYFTNCKKQDFGVDCQVMVASVGEKVPVRP